jgi:hypothetical protein
MIMRVMTLLRGVLTLMRVDVHACTLWKHLAEEVLVEDPESTQV